MDQIATFVIDLIFKPGTSLQLVPAINASIIFLLGVLCFLAYTKIDTIHIVVMSSLAIGLMLSVNWVYYEIQQAKRNPKESDSNNVSTTDKKTD